MLAPTPPSTGKTVGHLGSTRRAELPLRLLWPKMTTWPTQKRKQLSDELLCMMDTNCKPVSREGRLQEQKTAAGKGNRLLLQSSAWLAQACNHMVESRKLLYMHLAFGCINVMRSHTSDVQRCWCRGPYQTASLHRLHCCTSRAQPWQHIYIYIYICV